MTGAQDLRLSVSRLVCKLESPGEIQQLLMSGWVPRGPRDWDFLDRGYDLDFGSFNGSPSNPTAQRGWEPHFKVGGVLTLLHQYTCYSLGGFSRFLISGGRFGGKL